jgi:hypothetical protein
MLRRTTAGKLTGAFVEIERFAMVFDTQSTLPQFRWIGQKPLWIMALEQKM